MPSDFYAQDPWQLGSWIEPPGPVKMLDERYTKGDPRNLKNSLFFSLFSGNSGIIVGAMSDGPVGRACLVVLLIRRRIRAGGINITA
jgi:hypothetical protein